MQGIANSNAGAGHLHVIAEITGLQQALNGKADSNHRHGISGKPNTLLVLDPPYLCTHQESYKQARYFDLVDFLRLIHLTKPPYVFFSSTKSEFIRFIDAMVMDKWDNWQTFDTTQRIVVQTSPSYNGQYEDNMVYKF